MKTTDRRDFFLEAAQSSANKVREHVPFSDVLLPKKKTLPAQTQKTRSLILSSGDPINNSGMRFGGEVNGMCLLPKSTDRFFLVLSHAKHFPELFPNGVNEQTTGITVLDFQKKNDWVFVQQSSQTKRFHAGTEVLVRGSHLNKKTLKLYTVEEVQRGVRHVHSLTATPWGTALALDSSGGVLELNPETGSLIKRLGLGLLSYQGIEIEKAATGKKVRIALKHSNGQRICESHQPFESRLINWNHQLLDLVNWVGFDFESDSAWEFHCKQSFPETLPTASCDMSIEFENVRLLAQTVPFRGGKITQLWMEQPVFWRALP